MNGLGFYYFFRIFNAFCPKVNAIFSFLFYNGRKNNFQKVQILHASQMYDLEFCGLDCNSVVWHFF